MATIYHDFIQRFTTKNENFGSMKESSNKYGETKTKSKKQSEKKKYIDSYDPILYARDSKNHCSSSYGFDGDGGQPFLNYGDPNYQFQTSNPMTYNSVFVDVPSGLEEESLHDDVNNKSTSPAPIMRRYKPRNITECNIAQEESRLLYNKVPSFYEVIENPTTSTFKQVRDAKLKLIEDERKFQLEKIKTASIETPVTPQLPQPDKPVESSPDTCPMLPEKETPEKIESQKTESPGKTESRSFHTVHTKHCIACIIESMKRLPDCCIKKALFLNPIYISNDCSSKPVYLQ